MLDGMIIFPSTGVFANLGPMGVSMFFVSTLVGQLAFTFGGSGFAGANGSMMIEVVVRFHSFASNPPCVDFTLAFFPYDRKPYSYGYWPGLSTGNHRDNTCRLRS
jgi:hypothetical protein